eukprot:CAMPEP_0181355836 /NCGR_PEP_ID=MMETSP1106-20121128/4110_1 /TAXON_ID=81844 /ORGANISM="Mantoniella antarctica, Strain SL-175" /LENGTH=621 /DNA_ID=CAMNT_0023468599 /DNA_START=247 /DNA_END=2108 /DNA_ORIENTATION=+
MAREGSIESLLRSEGWSVKSEAVETAAAAAGGRGEGQLDPAAVRDTLLNLDLTEVGSPCLPGDAKGTIVGPMVLQLVSARDVACPKRAACLGVSGGGGVRGGGGGGGGGHRRMFRFELTDGVSTVTGIIEFRALTGRGLHDGCALAPGSKLVLASGAQVRRAHGILLFQGHHLQLLGGRVPALAEEWEQQQMYATSGAHTIRHSGCGDRAENITAPPFRLYDPEEAATTAAAAPAGRAAANQAAAAAAASTRSGEAGGATAENGATAVVLGGATAIGAVGRGATGGMPRQQQSTAPHASGSTVVVAAAAATVAAAAEAPAFIPRQRPALPPTRTERAAAAAAGGTAPTAAAPVPIAAVAPAPTAVIPRQRPALPPKRAPAHRDASVTVLHGSGGTSGDAPTHAPCLLRAEAPAHTNLAFAPAVGSLFSGAFLGVQGVTDHAVQRSRLLDRLAPETGASVGGGGRGDRGDQDRDRDRGGRGGRGDRDDGRGGRERGGRGGNGDDRDGDDGSLTMAEHGASRGARDTTAADAHDGHSLTSRGNGGSVLAQLADDEALARQLQHSLDMESAEETAGGHNHAFGGYGDKYGDGYGKGRGYEGGRGYSGGTRSSGSRRAGGGARGA